ncbi:uncharacterized protein LOC142179797 [Nicotiana tabacum]|uniref:Uncharacterized protein LOC142179797 n=1 Tax=Nicotiana tabacum TaxID=4097 RepID=A0AC58UBY7_TOBAC
MAELSRMSQTVEELVKKPTILLSNYSEDPTLQLPNHLLRSIFSYLKCQDLVHVCVVSKNWHRNTPSYFAFDFDESLFFENLPSTSLSNVQKSHNNFLDLIRSSLETCKIRLSKAEKRILRLQFNHPENIYNILKLIDENNFHEVYLRFGNGLYFSLPCIFQSTCLTVLHLTCCALNEQIFNGKEKFDSLQELKLDGVKLSRETLSEFISKCPYIRELSLVNCNLLSFIVLPKLDSLKKLYVKLNTYHSITNIQVIAPNLQVFHFVYTSLKQVAVNMDIRACRMLQEFHLDCLKFPIGLDHKKFCSDFPHLETLLLGPCETWKPVKISSPSLRTLILFFTRMYEYSRTGVVSAPNLCYFEYIGTTFKPFLAPNDTPKFLKTRIILVYNMEKINRAWFLKLRSHLKNFSNSITLSLCIREEEVRNELESRREGNCCSYTGNKCWRHFLKDFEVHEQVAYVKDKLTFMVLAKWGSGEDLTTSNVAEITIGHRKKLPNRCIFLTPMKTNCSLPSLMKPAGKFEFQISFVIISTAVVISGRNPWPTDQIFSDLNIKGGSTG